MTGRKRFIRSFLVQGEIGAGAFAEKLRTRNECFDRTVDVPAVRHELRAHRGDEFVVRGNQTASKRIGDEFAAEVVHEIVLAMAPDILLQAREAGAFAAVARKRGASVDRAPSKIGLAALTRWAEAFEDQAERIEALVTGRTSGVLAVAGEHV